MGQVMSQIRMAVLRRRLSDLCDLDILESEVLLGPERRSSSSLHLQRTDRFLLVQQIYVTNNSLPYCQNCVYEQTVAYSGRGDGATATTCLIVNFWIIFELFL